MLRGEEKKRGGGATGVKEGGKEYEVGRIARSSPWPSILLYKRLRDSLIWQTCLLSQSHELYNVKGRGAGPKFLQ